jgi:hypothetical protein
VAASKRFLDHYREYKALAKAAQLCNWKPLWRLERRRPNWRTAIEQSKPCTRTSG